VGAFTMAKVLKAKETPKSKESNEISDVFAQHVCMYYFYVISIFRSIILRHARDIALGI
jgi:hypothetical protein